MQKVYLLALLFILPASLFSQGHYIIPDIGAPDMAVYVELVAPNNQKGYFGNDGFYLPGVSTEVSVNITKNTQYVTFGPMIVSWEGRLVSTHIFVNKTANPTQTTPDPAFQVEFEIVGTSVATARSFTFSIVKPQSIGVNGDISGINETIIGQGNLGFRSARGAMIVDSLYLRASETYTLSTSDPDGNLSNGNQGYFPIIILSKGPIVGNGATISASAVNKEAGPGGGGGGGSFSDLLLGSGGSDGGSGFTSGGKGGTNKYASSSGDYKAFGQGTGSNGYSFNGIASFDPTPFGGWEASYGGTGHPFGTIGSQSLDGQTADAQGGMGGGSGYRNNTQGGAGGYATAGEGDNVTGGTTGGKVVGNAMMVPFAGGSGGAGGNPQASLFNTAVSSGNGGGGGGALMIFAPNIDNIVMTANGANGENGHDEADGGPGSGGATSIMAKVGLSNFSLSVDGGHYDGRDGGSGRVRFDGFASSATPTFLPNTASAYRGISTDTSNIVKPKHRLTGTHRPGDSLFIYIKSENTDWTLFNSFSTGSVGWANNFNFPPNHEDEYYIVVIQNENRSVNDFTYEPGLVLSQAATNIFRFGEPKIYCPKDTSFDVINCANVFYEDSIQIQSIGGDYLHINVQNTWVFGNKGFSVLNVGEYDVSPQSPDSLFYIKFSYTKQAGQSGVITDTLILVNQKLGTDTCRIAVSINLNSPEVSFLNADLSSEIDTLFLDDICIGDLSSKEFNIKNISKFALNDLSFVIKANDGNPANDFTANPAGFTNLLVDETKSVEISFQDLDNNHFNNGVSVKLFIYSAECPDPIDSLVIFIKVLNSELALSEPDNSLDFGSVPVGQTKDLIVTLTNTGDRPALIQVPNPVNTPFSLISPASTAFPILLNSIKVDPTAKINFTYRFTPLTNNDFKDSTLFVSFADITKNSCEAEVKMYLTGISTIAKISFNDTLDFGVLYECQTDSQDVYIKNESDFMITIDTAGAKLVGVDLDHFEIANKPRTISKGGQNQFRIRYIPPIIPTTSGLKQSKVQFELDPTTGEVFEIFLKADIDTFLVDYSPGKPFDLGKVPVGFDVPTQQLSIINNGKLPRTLVSFQQIVGSKLSITNVAGLPVIISAGGSVTFDVDISLLATDVGNFSETVIAQFEECNTELPINVIAEGVEGKLDIVGNFDLGKLPPCFNLTEDVEFRNTGQADIRLDSVILFDESGVENSRLNFSPFILSEYDGTNGFKTKYDVIGDRLPFGIHRFRLVAYVFENGATNQYPVEVICEVSSGLIITPNPVDYGSVMLNNTVTQSISISKDPTAPFAAVNDIRVNIDRANLVIPYNEYQFTSPNSLLFAVGQNGAQTFDIDFTPTLSQSYLDTLQLYVTMPGCDYSVPLALNGSGAEGDTLLIYAKQLDAVEPNINEFHIPIYATLKTKDNSVDKSVSVQLKQLDIDFNKTVFFPMELVNGNFIMRTTDPSLSIIRVQMQAPVSVSNKGETTLMELIGPTMLGNAKDNLIHLGATPALYDSTGIAEIIAQSGYLNLTICEEGGQRLLEHTNGFDYSLLKVNEEIQIKANLVEPGYHKIELVSLTGKSEIIAEINRTKGDRNEYSINYDVSSLSSGVYYVTFKTPSRFKTKKLIIID